MTTKKTHVTMTYVGYLDVRCARAQMKWFHTSLLSPALEKVRLPILQTIDKKYKELTNNSFMELTTNEKTGLILGCSTLLENAKD